MKLVLNFCGFTRELDWKGDLAPKQIFICNGIQSSGVFDESISYGGPIHENRVKGYKSLLWENLKFELEGYDTVRIPATSGKWVIEKRAIYSVNTKI